MKAMLGLVNGLVTTRNMLRAKSLVAMGRPKRGGLRWVRRVLTGSKGRWLMVATLFGFAMPWQRALYALILVVVALFQTTKVSLLLCCNDTPADYRHPPRKVNAHTKRTQQQKKLRCKLYATPFANTSRRAKRNPRLRTPSPNLRLITEITVSTFQR
jgi:hypothetical protein